MESTVLVAPPVQKQLDRFVRACLFIDKPNDEERANRKVLADRFGTATIPSYYLLDPDGKVIASQVACDEASFLAFLAKG
jgi:hypothetical protein